MLRSHVAIPCMNFRQRYFSAKCGHIPAMKISPRKADYDSATSTVYYCNSRDGPASSSCQSCEENCGRKKGCSKFATFTPKKEALQMERLKK